MAVNWLYKPNHFRSPVYSNLFIKLSFNPVNLFSHFNHALSKYSTRPISRSTDEIREEFIKYFQNHGHKFIRSSPVVPHCDPSVTFVNAGMNQFKSVFLGINPPPAPRAVNSQKCIRVGGRHNDLEVVGSDSYHHTFFEMLGSWSFGDYFKRDACKYSWEHLTKMFALDPKRLYVTYFGGEKNTGLEPDLETREIWLEMGVPESHVLPFGVKDNFWEMGPTGPCGPCSEVHYDFHGRTLASERVNAGFPDLIELWNIVFIQYVRHENGTLSPLPCKHVDTGMGLERLACVMQGVTSTYDTDIFRPLFHAIQKITGAPAYEGKFLKDDIHGTDTAYRILADHARMITVAIADGMLPDHNHRLRRVIRRALSVSQDLLRKGSEGHKLLFEICAQTANSLESAYPGIVPRLESIKAVLAHEEQVLLNLRSHSSSQWSKLISKWPQLADVDVASSPGLVQAFEELQALVRNGVKSVNEKMAFSLYDTYGLNEDFSKAIR
ncbi:hypothetical protein J437_LFUL015523 [Ladona fulva]|uniref:alanine--tRNA ligase n=1 Tax=Ladona fulva TaxID=123851 RepID=A0A8K0KHH4_LADFU|nr:hypothetical protein J437_LFUL015523 [Ladona fulva]